MKRLLLIISLLAVAKAEAQTTNVSANVTTMQALTNYVRGAFSPTQFNTNSYPYILTNIPAPVAVNSVTVSNAFSYLTNPVVGYILTILDTNGLVGSEPPVAGSTYPLYTNLPLISSATNFAIDYSRPDVVITNVTGNIFLANIINYPGSTNSAISQIFIKGNSTNFTLGYNTSVFAPVGYSSTNYLTLGASNGFFTIAVQYLGATNLNAIAIALPPN